MRNLLKTAFILSTTILIYSCGENQSEEETTTTDSVQTINIKPVEPQTKMKPEVNDTAVLKDLTKEILTSIKEEEYGNLARYFHPDSGVRFSPYAFIDVAKNIQLSSKEYTEGIKSNTKFIWGYSDGSGDAIELTIPEYLKKFVYSSDFLHAEKTAVNKMIGNGNSINNLEKVYPDAFFTESYDPGKHEMGWKSIRLVFKKKEDKFYLIGIVNDRWTI